MSLTSVQKDLSVLADPVRAAHSLRFFKTGPGEYGEGDKFLGITTPDQRKIASKYWDEFSLASTISLLHGSYHEERFVALIILTKKFAKSTKEEKKAIYQAYLANTKYINNWDLVDCSAHKIVGQYLLDQPRDILFKLAKSDLLWERRISVIATFAFIANGVLDDSLKLAIILLPDKQDLIHKAVGWVLREVGKKDEKKLTNFLDQYALEMPRTMLRYAIEKLDEKKKQYYLHLK